MRAPRSAEKIARREAAELRAALRRIGAGLETRARPGSPALPGQPLDAALLGASALYRRSRALFLERAARAGAPPEVAHSARLLSSPRSLGSPTLVEPRIEYSPVDRELAWASGLPAGADADARLRRVRGYVTSVFHEQNHRTLWPIFPPPPTGGPGLRRYLNFAESVVVALDMALSDGLAARRGGGFARDAYLCGALYDPGTRVASERPRPRDYRNYLQAAACATYLNLEGYAVEPVARALVAFFGETPDWARRIADRAFALDRAFVERTNPLWQRRHARTAARALRRGRAGEAPLALPADPRDDRLRYLWTEMALSRLSSSPSGRARRRS